MVHLGERWRKYDLGFLNRRSQVRVLSGPPSGFSALNLFNDLACGLCTEGGRVCNTGVLILAPQLLGHAAGSEPFLICGVGVTLDLRQRSRSRWRRSQDRFGSRELLIEATETAPVG